MSKKVSILLLFLGILAFISIIVNAVLIVLYVESRNSKSSPSPISSFEECEDAGYIILESYPRQCKTPSGMTFVEVIPTTTAGIPNPASKYCVENDGKLDIREDATGGQVGYCVFPNGAECEEWKYFNGECSKDDKPVSGEKTVTIYLFDRDKFDEPGQTDYLTGVKRMTSRNDVAAFSIEQIIVGPTNAEASQNLDDTFGEDALAWFTSSSNCNGKDFKISIANKKATVQFCRDTSLAGDMSGFVITDQIEKTLKQFPSVETVVILNKSGNCFDDMPGLNPADCIQ